MEDDKISKLSYEVDDFISLMITKHNMDPLHLGAIMAARIFLVNQHVGSGDDFRKLMANLPDTKLKDVEVFH